MIVNRQRHVRVSLGPLAQFLDRLRETLRLPDETVTVCLVSDAQIAHLNRAFRGNRRATDVLSFPANGAGPGRSAQRKPRKQGTANGQVASYLGDIAISPQAARRNARRFGRTLPEELRILILHGVLHLMGFDHETDRGEMERLECRLRGRLGLR